MLSGNELCCSVTASHLSTHRSHTPPLDPLSRSPHFTPHTRPTLMQTTPLSSHPSPHTPHVTSHTPPLIRHTFSSHSSPSNTPHHSLHSSPSHTPHSPHALSLSHTTPFPSRTPHLFILSPSHTPHVTPCTPPLYTTPFSSHSLPLTHHTSLLTLPLLCTGDDVCGVSVRIRFDQNVIQIWNQESELHYKATVS